MKTILIKVIISVLLLISCNSETNSVEFEVTEGKKGLNAVNVKIV